jgi:hypothetical protein
VQQAKQVQPVQQAQQARRAIRTKAAEVQLTGAWHVIGGGAPRPEALTPLAIFPTVA